MNKFAVIADHSAAFGNYKANYIRRVRILYRGAYYTIRSYFQVENFHDKRVLK